MFLWLHTHTNTYAHTYTHTHTYTLMNRHTHTHTYAHTHTNAQTPTHLQIHIHTYTRTHLHMQFAANNPIMQGQIPPFIYIYIYLWRISEYLFFSLIKINFSDKSQISRSVIFRFIFSSVIWLIMAAYIDIHILYIYINI